MTVPSNNYLSFLLRVWKSQDGSQVFWRASLEDTRDGCQWRFQNMEAMNKFLNALLLDGKIPQSSDVGQKGAK